MNFMSLRKETNLAKEEAKNLRKYIAPWIISDWAPNFGPAEWWNRKTKNEL